MHMSIRTTYVGEIIVFMIASLTENAYSPYTTACCGLSALLGIGRFSVNTIIHKHGKLDRQKITPLSYENIHNKPYVKQNDQNHVLH